MSRLLPLTLPLIVILAGARGDDLSDLRGRAAGGDAEACFELGGRYLRGEGVPQDNRLAAEWYAKSADKDHTGAEIQLGYLRSHGLGLERDFAEAARWYRRAAAKGDPNGQYNMGMQSLYGQGMRRDPAQAAHWFRLAAAQGHARAAFALAELYELGKGVDVDDVRACIGYTLAAGHSDPESHFGKALAEDLVRRRDELTRKLSMKDRDHVKKEVGRLTALIDVHPRRFGGPGGVGKLRGWYFWEKWHADKGEAEVRHEESGERHTVRLLPWTTTYRHLVHGVGPDALLPGERVNLFFSPDEHHPRGYVTHFQDEIGQMKAHGHAWEVVAPPGDGADRDTFTARVLTREGPLDGRTHRFTLDPACQFRSAGKESERPGLRKGDRYLMTWVEGPAARVVKWLSDEASLDAVRDEQKGDLDRQLAADGLGAWGEVVEGDQVDVLIFPRYWSQAAGLKVGTAVKLSLTDQYYKPSGLPVSGRVTFNRNRGAYGAGPTDILVKFDRPEDADVVRGWLEYNAIRVIVP